MKHQPQTDDERRIKRNARKLANLHQQLGKLIVQPCEKCGVTGAQKHHDDYSKPLEVRWLYRRCHFNEHGKTGTCSRCEEPPASGSRYCKGHRAEYQREWRRRQLDELSRLRSMFAAQDAYGSK